MKGSALKKNPFISSYFIHIFRNSIFVFTLKSDLGLYQTTDKLTSVKLSDRQSDLCHYFFNDSFFKLCASLFFNTVIFYFVKIFFF